MSIIRTTIGKAVFGGSVAAGIERQPQDIGINIVGSGQTFEEPSAEAVAMPAKIEVMLNRAERRALKTPKGQFGAFVAENSFELTKLHESLTTLRDAEGHRERSMGKARF